ncbi:MAG: S49 family peptidase [Proteobacteria bacterium]|nr:S49 family peptidase [Desulfobacula sp.]MBU3951018.1 S49 family peptidase [Pseudomonadota bacterium]MBU4131586.1 S49 family peptidase [Pseudomonadota bacterium]
MDSISNRPLAIYEPTLSTLPKTKAGWVTSQPTVVGTITAQKISIQGVLYPETYKNIRTAVDAVTSSHIILDINSPGGIVAGCFDLCDYLSTIGQKKKIYALVEDQCCSAAYAIASTAKQIYICRSAVVGSVGVLVAHIDQSKFDSDMGFKFTVIHAGAKKNQFSSHNPLSSQAQKDLQRMVDLDYEVFCQIVSKGRGMTVQAVKNTEAGIFQGQDSVSSGFADGVFNSMEFDTAIAADIQGVSLPGQQLTFQQAWQSIKAKQGCTSMDAMGQAAKDYPDLYEMQRTGRTPAAQPVAPKAKDKPDQGQTFQSVWTEIKKRTGCSVHSAMKQAAHEYPDLYERQRAGA